MAQPKTIAVAINLPDDDDVTGTWSVNEKEQQAAWEIYVELVTRIPVVELGPNEGLLSEALSSLYSLFDSTRIVLRGYGPEVARPERKGDLSLTHLSLILLNRVLRPVLAKYHPLLLDFEGARPEQVPPSQHERNWNRNAELRDILNGQLRDTLIQYADLFAKAAAVPSMINRQPN